MARVRSAEGPGTLLALAAGLARTSGQACVANHDGLPWFLSTYDPRAMGPQLCAAAPELQAAPRTRATGPDDDVLRALALRGEGPARQSLIVGDASRAHTLSQRLARAALADELPLLAHQRVAGGSCQVRPPESS